MKRLTLLLLLMLPVSVFAQSTSEAVLKPPYAETVTSTVSTVLATGVACTDSTNAVVLASPLEVRGNEYMNALLIGLNITDSVKFMQYSWTKDVWVPLRAWIQHSPIVAPGGISNPSLIQTGTDTAVTWISRVITPPLGATIKARIELVTDGAVKIYRGVNDTTIAVRRRQMYSKDR